MEFFCCHRDRPGSEVLRGELIEEHWAYMDRYAAQMIARGPTFAPDGETPTGSLRTPMTGEPAERGSSSVAAPEHVHGKGVEDDLIVLVEQFRAGADDAAIGLGAGRARLQHGHAEPERVAGTDGGGPPEFVHTR